jgi:hypothetical protein
MKQFKAIVAVLGMALCVTGCNLTKNQNAEQNSVNAAAPENAMPAANAAANDAANAAVENNSTAPANATNNGERTDTGPRGNPNG